MAAVTDLQSASVLLSQLMLNHTRFALIQAVAWLDPASLSGHSSNEDGDFNYDEEDDLTTALHVCRCCFPDVYSAANQLLLQGTRSEEVEQYLCTGINAHLVTAVDSLEELRYGPPLECYGLDVAALLESSDESEQPYAPYTAAFALFEITVGRDNPADIWRKAANAALVLQYTLENHPSPIYQDLWALIAWLFSISGNTLVDWTQEALWESGSETPEWTPDEVAFVNEMTREAQEVMDAVERGRQALEQNAKLRNGLTQNLKYLFKMLDKKGKAHAHTRFSDTEYAALACRLTWPECDGDSDASQTDTHA